MQFFIAPNGEIIEPAVYDVDVFDADGLRLHAAGDDVPIDERFTAEFVGMLRAYDPVAEPNPPERAPPPVPAPTPAEVLAMRDARLAAAALRIAPLADAVELDDATAAEVAALKAWRQYRVALNRIEQQSGFPSAVVWPDAPA